MPLGEEMDQTEGRLCDVEPRCGGMLPMLEQRGGGQRAQLRKRAQLAIREVTKDQKSKGVISHYNKICFCSK